MRRLRIPALTLLLLVLGVACQRLSPEERVERLRRLYTAELNSILFEDHDDTPSEGGEATEPQKPIRVRLDILLTTQARSDERLPGITLDVSQVDEAHHEKDHRLLWVETSEIGRGPGTQITQTLENVAYQEGDGFNVEVRSPIPPSERSRYREFSSASP